MTVAPKELQSLINWRPFGDYHSRCEVPIDDDLKRFLDSTMDEVRTSTSNRIARSILHIIEIKDFGLFRKSVLRRELSGTIAYPRQRDHSSHTLYNYLLGWYFLRHSTALEEALSRHLQVRGAGRVNADWPFANKYDYFGCIWQYVSLLHDIGYMFEGGLPSLGFRDSIEQAEIGIRAARDYFHRQIWTDSIIDTPYLRSKLFDLVGGPVTPPSFDRVATLGDVANQLQFMGESLEVLEEPILEDLDKLGLPADRRPSFDELSSDAFEVWINHYKTFGNPGMATRIESLRKVFNGLIDDGLPGVDLRLLDHGVCSGLLLLMASTYYYRLYARAKLDTTGSPLVRRFINGGSWSPAFWWTGIVWATAATALHNVQQISDANKLDRNWPGQLRLEDDPLAYLGILVDVLEEWDRYSVFKTLDNEPIQGTEVELQNDGGRVLLQFTGPRALNRAKKLRDNLATTLVGWATLVEVQP